MDEQDNKNDDEKVIPVKHYYFDFRNVLLRHKVEQAFGNKFGTIQKGRKYKIIQEDDFYSEFDLSRFFEALNKEYGDDVEK